MRQSSSHKILPLITKGIHSRNRSKGSISSLSSQVMTPSSSIRRELQDSFHNVFEESHEYQQKGTVGPEAKLEFYQDYKHINRLNEKIKVQQAEFTPSIAYLSNLDKNNLRPKTFGLVKRTGSENSIDIRLFSMGDKYAEAFSHGLKHYPLLETLNLKSNRLTDMGNEKILNNVELRQIKHINLAENKIGPKSLEKIVEMISISECRLKSLNLEKTHITAKLIPDLCNSLIYNKRLTKLVLAKNGLTDIATKYFKDLLAQNISLKILDLHWNNFGPQGAMNIFDGLVKNNTLMVLDVSWNSMGKSKLSAESIGKALKSNYTLAHLDLSYNSITSEDAQIISEYLISNHTLLGLHMIGNTCEVDTKGFISISSKKHIKKGHFYQRMIDRPEFAQEKLNVNCWVCEKWVEVTFSCESEGNSVYLHLEIDGYQADAMPSDGQGHFELTRAVPPHIQSFFFTEIKDNPIKSCYKKVKRMFEMTISYEDGVKKFVKITSLNQITPEGEVCDIKNPFSTKPRTKIVNRLMPVGQMERIPWSIHVSLFKDYKLDNDRLLDDCLEFDWRHSRIPNFIRNPEEQIALKTAIRQVYGQIKLTYKNLSAYGGSDIFSIGSNVFTDFLNECKIIDNLYGPSDLGVNLNSTLIQKEKGQVYNPGNSLIRYEFIEIIVRVAGDRYIRNKICSSNLEAFQKLLKEHLWPVINKFTSEKWRIEKYFCEEVDLVLKVNKQIFLALFKKYSGKHTLPGKKPFMSLEEFRMLCNDAGLVGDNFATREIDVCFSQAMMTQVDELYVKRHLEMNFFEMLEALARAIDYSDVIKNMDGYKFISLIQTELSKKLEIATEFLLKLCPVVFQDDYEIQTTEQYTKLMYRMKAN